ncbi:MAG: hypothetical protein ACLU9S_13835 [Oscillospiraceae bacterium]
MRPHCWVEPEPAGSPGAVLGHCPADTLEIRRLPGIGETVVAETWPGPPSRTAYPSIW